MDKQRITRLLRDYRVADDDCRRDPYSLLEDLDEILDGYASAIAQAHEAEMATLRRTIALGAEYARKAMGSLATGGHGLVGTLDDLLGILNADGTRAEAELAALRARVAMLAGALNKLIDVAIDKVEYEQGDDILEVRIHEANAALSAAPKVAASLRLLEGYEGGTSSGHRRYASDENDWPWVAIDLPLSDPTDLGGAIVLVIADPERLRDSEQGQETK